MTGRSSNIWLDRILNLLSAGILLHLDLIIIIDQYIVDLFYRDSNLCRTISFFVDDKLYFFKYDFKRVRDSVIKQTNNISKIMAINSPVFYEVKL
jgi:hypothetical protein